MTRWNKILFSILLLFIASGLHASDWPVFRGADHNGISSETKWTAQWPADGPKKLWKASVGTGFSSMSVADGRVYTMGNAADTETVYCLDAKTGKKLWTHSYHCPIDSQNHEGGPSATPTVDGDRVFTFSRRGDVFCLKAGNGKVVWSTNLAHEFGLTLPKWGFAGSPLVVGDGVILNAGSAGIALDKKTGAVLWKSSTEASGYATPVPSSFDGVQCVVIAAMQTVVAVNATTGTPLWSYPWKTEYDINASDPIISGDEVFVSSGYEHGGALLRIHDGKADAVWENKEMRNQLSSSVLLNGYLYGFDGNAGKSALKCVEFTTGKTKWSFADLKAGAVLAAGGKLLVLGDTGELAVAEASPEGFKPISRFQALGGKCWTSPTLANGRLYCRNARGDLVCFDVK